MAHILILETQAELRQQLVRLLEKAGHRAAAVATITDAVAILQADAPIYWRQMPYSLMVRAQASPSRRKS